MANQPVDQKKDEKNEKDTTTPLAPDPKTLHTTDPQDNMKGPVSSAVQGVKDKVEENDKESKEEADKKKEENT